MPDETGDLSKGLVALIFFGDGVVFMNVAFVVPRKIIARPSHFKFIINDIL